MSYDFEQAKANLEEIKNDINQYLLVTYLDNSADAEKTFKYLEGIVDNIFKGKELSMKFNKGGSPEWYFNVLSKLANWLNAEATLNEILNDELNKNLE